MKNEAREKLKQILGAYDDKLATAERLETEKRAAHAAFPERFVLLKKDTILPALLELVELLNGRGHEATTHEQEESSSSAGGVASAAISLRVIPKPFTQRPVEAKRSFIEVTFSANRAERKIVVSSTNTLIHAGGSVGKRGAYELEALDADVVVEHVLQTLDAAFRT